MNDEPSNLRVPPHSVEAEQSVLGALLIDSAVMDRAADLVTEAEFYRHEHRLIFAAICELAKRGKPADVVSVFERLEAQGKAGDVGGLKYLNDLACSVPGTSNIRRHAEIVADKALLRKVIAACDDGASNAFNPQGKTSGEVLDGVAAALGGIERGTMRVAPKLVSTLLAGAIDRYTALSEGRMKPGMRTGFSQLDDLIDGLKPGKVYGIAARPSVGKSSFSRSMALRVAEAGNTVLFCSQEMPNEEQTDCIVSELGRIDNQRLQTGRFSQDDWERMVEAIERARELPLHFDDQGALTLADVRSKARAVKGLRLLIVDYLQLCKSTLKGKSTTDEIGEISGGLKALSLEMNIPVVVLSQLSRDVEKRGEKEPKLSDLRGSGDIEQDLDVVLFLWTADEAADGLSRTVGCKVAKHRGGRKGKFAMHFDGPVYGWSNTVFPASAQASQTRGRDL